MKKLVSFLICSILVLSVVGQSSTSYSAVGEYVQIILPNDVWTGYNSEWVEYDGSYQDYVLSLGHNPGIKSAPLSVDEACLVINLPAEKVLRIRMFARTLGTDSFYYSRDGVEWEYVTVPVLGEWYDVSIRAKTLYIAEREKGLYIDQIEVCSTLSLERYGEQINITHNIDVSEQDTLFVVGKSRELSVLYYGSAEAASSKTIPGEEGLVEAFVWDSNLRPLATKASVY